MFLPTVFRGDPADFHPLVATLLEGECITAAVVVGEHSSSSNISTPAPDAANDPNALAFLRPVVEGITLEDVAGALSRLDPGCSYGEWIEVAAALRHQFPLPPEAEEAFELFNSWSAQSEKYTTEEDTRQKWDSFRPNPRGRAPVTIRSLFRRAEEKGWRQAEQVGLRCFNQTREWLTHDARTFDELALDGLGRIAATPLLSIIHRGSLLGELYKALASRGHKVSKVDLKRQLAQMEKAAARHRVEVTPEDKWPSWARGITYVSKHNEFFQQRSNRKWSPEAFNNVFDVHLMNASERGVPEVHAKDYLLNILHAPRVDQYIYDPRTTDVIVRSGKTGENRAINLYYPTYPDSDYEDYDAGLVLLNHVKRLIKEPEYQQLFMDYLAFMVQYPGQKINWAILLQGAQGCGKSVIAEAMRGVLGSEHVRTISGDQLFTPFNEWARGSQLVAIEEIRVIGQNRHDVMAKLKPCIAGEYISVSQKYVDSYEMLNVTNYLMFTNYLDSLALTEGDRRYFVLNSPLAQAEDVKALPGDHFPKLWNMVKKRAAGLRAYLEKWPISSGFNPKGHAPVTSYMRELITDAASPLQFSIMEKIKDADHPLIAGDLMSITLLERMLANENVAGASAKNISSVLREMGYQPAGRVRVEEERQRFWIRRNLAGMDLSMVVQRRIKDFSLLD